MPYTETKCPCCGRRRVFHDPPPGRRRPSYEICERCFERIHQVMEDLPATKRSNDTPLKLDVAEKKTPQPLRTAR